MAYGGIEFVPGSARHLLLAGDETAVPAISSILECLPEGSRGAAFLEVPHADDVLAWRARSLTWVSPTEGMIDVADEEVDPDLWETPTYSSSGELLADEPAPHADLYAWIAGESKVVTGVRRHLVSGLGIDRRQVAFMGYWRRGVAMRS